MKDIIKFLIASALRFEAVLVLKKYKPKIIAITGTVGKTSTRDAIYNALKEFENVRKSPKNFNTDFGIPLTILGQDLPSKLTDLLAWIEVLAEGLIVWMIPHHYPSWLVLEVGTDRPGDIEAVTKWLKPDIVVVTRLSKIPVHVEAFPAPQDLFNEKGNLVKALKQGGTLVLNGEDELVMKYQDLTPEKVVTFGGGEGYEIMYGESGAPAGVRFVVEGQVIELRGVLGKQSIQHIAAAMAVMRVLGEDVAVAAAGFSRETPTAGRMRIVPGLNGSTIIDDTYNSSPIAVEEALNTLKMVKGKRKIAALGDMLELGRYSSEAHRQVGEKAGKIADLLVTVGIRSRTTAEASLTSGMKEGEVAQFNTSAEAGAFLKDVVKSGDIILVKGSQGTRMERVVEALMAEPKQKSRLLVRQGEEWKNK